MAKTLELTEKGMEASSKFYQEKAQELTSLIGEVTVLVEALKRSLSESDGQLDDLTKVTAAQMTLYQAQQQRTQGQ